jgi:hypothetical protein
VLCAADDRMWDYSGAGKYKGVRASGLPRQADFPPTPRPRHALARPRAQRMTGIAPLHRDGNAAAPRHRQPQQRAISAQSMGKLHKETCRAEDGNAATATTMLYDTDNMQKRNYTQK